MPKRGNSMSMRDNLDISAYLVLGPENTLGRPVADVVAQAVAAGFTCVQVRSKECSARELISCTAQASEVIRQAGAQDRVALLIDDRLDAVYAARQQGIKVDGVHVGQTDIPVEACRALLGPDAVVGLSARADEMLEYVKTADMSLSIIWVSARCMRRRRKPTAVWRRMAPLSRKASRTWRRFIRQAPFPSWSAGE